jgi:hypothetical protein
MTTKYSKALLNEIMGGKSVRQALEDFVLDVYEGTCPTNPEDARTGTKLARYTLSGSALGGTTDRSSPPIYKIIIASHGTADTFPLALNVDGLGAVTHLYTHAGTVDGHILDDMARGLARFINDIPQLHAIPSGNADGIVMVQGRIAGLTFTLADATGGSGTFTVYKQICGPITGEWTTVTFPTANKDYANKTGIGTANPAGYVINVTGGTGGAGAVKGSYTVILVVSADSVQVDRAIHAHTSDITDGTCTTGPGAAIRKNTLQFGAPTAALPGVISKPTGDTWQDSSNDATGVAGYFTICTPDDTIAADTTYVKKRVQGTLASVGGDATIDPATITAAAVSTVSTFSLTLPTSKT